MAAMYGRGAPAPATQTPYGQVTTMGDVTQHPLSTAQPTVPLGRRHSPPQSQEQRPSPPQAQQSGSEVSTH